MEGLATTLINEDCKFLTLSIKLVKNFDEMPVKKGVR